MSLSFTVQFASSAPHLPARAQVRRWASATCAVVSEALKLKNFDCEITIRYMDEREGRELNKSFRRKDYATNVLTFAQTPPQGEGTVRADIAICVPVVAREAKLQKKTVHAHHAHMVVHGMLHALGFDHENETDAREMETIEVRVLQRFRINNPYE